ncbi:MAG: HEAT repeat domain-containing protein [Planctomycetaceae bacterium]|jgi:HEAT repeat protein|nr:HEAT repeat domain-containing protein [Planctomycetaceae bacterium]
MTFLAVLCGCRAENAASPTREETDTSAEKSSISDADTKTYDGLTAEEWRARLKMLGPDLPGASAAIPGLTQLVADRTVDLIIRRRAIIMIGRLGQPGLESLSTLKTLLKEDARKGHPPAAWAAKAIALLGPAAKEATPELITRLNAPSAHLESRLACLEALARIGGVHADVIPAILEQLKFPSSKLDVHQQLEIRRGAIDALALIGPDASIAVPVLMDYLYDSNDLLRAKVVIALGAIGPSASPASSAVAEKLLFDDAEEVRREAALALAKLGTDGERLLTGLTRDEEPLVREFCLIALGQNSSLSEEAVTGLTSSLDDENDRVRLVAAKALAKHSQQRAQVVSTLIDLLIGSERKTRREAADLWVVIKPDAEEWSRLERMMKSTMDEYSRRIWNSMQRSRP